MVKIKTEDFREYDYDIAAKKATSFRRYMPFIVIGGILAGVGTLQLAVYGLFGLGLLLMLGIIDLAVGIIFLGAGIAKKTGFLLKRQVRVKWGAVLIIAGVALGAMLVIDIRNIRWFLRTAPGFECLDAASDGTYIYTYGISGSHPDYGSYDALIKWDSSGNQLWYRTWGRSNAAQLDVWVDGAGCIYTLGVLTLFDVHVEGTEMMLVKWDANGNVLWNRTWSGLVSNHYVAMYDDGLGHMYTISGDYYGWKLVKWHSATGTQLWNMTNSSIMIDVGKVLWADEAENVYVVGNIGNHMSLAKWDASGNPLWNRVSTFTISFGKSILCGDGTGNVYTFSGTNRSPSFSDTDTILVKWNSTGSQVWNQTWDGGLWDGSDTVWYDGAGSVYTGGRSYLPSQGFQAAVLSKWDTAGTFRWRSTWENYRGIFSIWNAGAGQITSLSLDPSPYGRNGDILVKRWDAAGNAISSQSWDNCLGEVDYYLFLALIFGLVGLCAISAIMYARQIIRKRQTLTRGTTTSPSGAPLSA